MTLPEIVQFLTSRKIPFAQLGSRDAGRAVVIEEGARVVALSAPGGDDNVLWTHPANKKAKDRAAFSAPGPGGIGGIRLWQAPELGYMWNGTPNPATFANYEVQPEMDPGSYCLEQVSARRCVLTGTVRLEDYRGGPAVDFAVRRIVEIGALPELYRPLASGGVTLRFQNHLKLVTKDPGVRVDFWHLMQLPAGTLVGAQVCDKTEPLSYFNAQNADGWKVEHGAFTWRTNGKRLAKFGFAASSITGGPFAVCEAAAAHAGVFIWNIPRALGSTYADSPPGVTRDDQLVQFWDGFDFCEVEYHSPAATPDRPEIFDASELTYLKVTPGQRQPFQKITGIPLL